MKKKKNTYIHIITIAAISFKYNAVNTIHTSSWTQPLFQIIKRFLDVVYVREFMSPRAYLASSGNNVIAAHAV